MSDTTMRAADAGFAPAGPRRTLRLRTAPWLRRAAAPLALLLAWQAAGMADLVPAATIPAPLTILHTLATLAISGDLLGNLAVSAARVAAGLAIGVAAGGALALIAGLSRAGEEAVDAPLQMLRTLPHLALVPLFILWFGIGETPKIALVALGAAFPIYLNLFAAIRGVDPRLIETARVLGLNRRGVIAHVVLPGALPGALTGLRYAVGLAWLSLVVGEQINAASGIGHMMMDAREFLRTDIIMAGLVVYALLGLATDQAVRAIERRALAWRPALLGSAG